MKKHLSLLAMLLLFSACETQIGTAIGTAITNVVTGKAFTSGGEKAYNEIKADNDAHPYNPNLENCKVPDKRDSLFSGIEKIKNQLCTCQTWGTCDSKSCSCGILCPNNFSILNRSGTANSDHEDDSLAFTNGDTAFYKNDSMYSGYCWGHASVTQKFNRLAKFDGSKTKVLLGKNNDEKRISYYKAVIKQLHDNQPVEILGFKNLKEFSSDPEVKTLLTESVKETWAENAMTTQGLGMVTSSASQGTEYYNKLFDDIEYRVNNFQQPTIVFNRDDSATVSHATLVSGYGKFSNGERYLCIRDNNFQPEGIKNCGRKMILKTNGTIYYEGFYSNIGKVVLAHSENNDTVEQVKNLRDKCRSDKNCSAN